MIIATMLLAILFAVVGYIVGYCCGREDRELKDFAKEKIHEYMDGRDSR